MWDMCLVSTKSHVHPEPTNQRRFDVTPARFALRARSLRKRYATPALPQTSVQHPWAGWPNHRLKSPTSHDSWPDHRPRHRNYTHASFLDPEGPISIKLLAVRLILRPFGRSMFVRTRAEFGKFHR